ncbi:DeoR/GlpR family DNA-binding transcription regulator [Hirschia litorea]|uniref:DeoR/GlpR family DNA-binding transcription regulator n=1 Tax=Hirschia litorea TaxID=1199156 RepID=A0ABW2IP58_9PROT
MDKLSDRQNSILQLVEAQGFVATERLVEALGVTPQTIRRDINQLCDLNLLQRFHGGAGRSATSENQPYSARREAASVGKERIARMVAKAIPDGASLFLNIGTTTEAVAEALLTKKSLTIVTNNLNVASTLARNESFEISIAGGLLRTKDSGIVGHSATEFMNRFRLDYGIIGVSGIETDGSLLDFDERETQTARAIIKNSSQTFLVADHTKFGRRAMIRFADLSEIDTVFTDEQPSSEFISLCKHANVELQVGK